MDAGTLVLVHLVQPKEKYWGEAVRGRARGKRRELRRTLLRDRGMWRPRFSRAPAAGGRRFLVRAPELNAGSARDLLGQLHEDPPRRRRMHERDEAAVRAREGLLVHESHARGLQRRERRAHVRDFEAQVVDARAALLERLRDGAVRRGRLEELEGRLTHGPERRHDLLRRDLLAVLLEEAEEIPERASLLERGDGDSEVRDSGDETREFLRR